MRILIIDDERPTLEMLALFLGAYGYDVLSAENGAQGVELFKAHRPEIVMTDIKMPGLDGIEVLKRIKAVDSATEVIVVTGHGDMDLAVKALNLNATDFINKPIQKDALEAALKRARERLANARQSGNAVSIDVQGHIAIMSVKGNVTARSEASLQEAYNRIIGMELHNVVLRFDENATINGAGIALLTQLLLEGAKKGQKVAITGVSDNFQKVFDIVGITRFAKLYDSTENAMASFGSA